MTATEASWYSALAPYVERDDLVVRLANPFLRPTGERVDALPSVFVRFPMWRGSPFVDDMGKKTAAMVELDGEHLFAELAILRLLERDGWEGRWIHTTSEGEITTVSHRVARRAASGAAEPAHSTRRRARAACTRSPIGPAIGTAGVGACSRGARTATRSSRRSVRRRRRPRAQARAGSVGASGALASRADDVGA